MSQRLVNIDHKALMHEDPRILPFRIPTVTADDIAHANRPSTKMLLAISATGRHLYQGTVDPAVVARRRAANKRARRARRAAR